MSEKLYYILPFVTKDTQSLWQVYNHVNTNKDPYAGWYMSPMREHAGRYCLTIFQRNVRSKPCYWVTVHFIVLDSESIRGELKWYLSVRICDQVTVRIYLMISVPCNFFPVSIMNQAVCNVVLQCRWQYYASGYWVYGLAGGLVGERLRSSRTGVPCRWDTEAFMSSSCLVSWCLSCKRVLFSSRRVVFSCWSLFFAISRRRLSCCHHSSS